MTVKDIDLQRVLHIHTVETLYAAVVEGYVALVEAVVRAELTGAAPMHAGGHELCVRGLANLLQLASSYREGREWSCECPHCHLLAGVRNYLAHHWGRGHAAFAISAGPMNAAATRARQDNVDDGSDACRYAPHVDIKLVSKRLKERRKVRRGGPRARQGCPAVQPGARRRSLPAVPVDEPCRLALGESAAGACRRPARLPGRRPCRAGQTASAALGGAGAGESRAGGGEPAVTGAKGAAVHQRSSLIQGVAPAGAAARLTLEKRALWRI